ncbi:MAG: hypothetical protein AAGD01_16220 [Acidobacteriota bacterium]
MPTTRLWITIAIFSLCLSALAPIAASAGEHRLGLGAHYWRTVDSLGDLNDLPDDGYSWMVSYQYKPRGLFTFEAAVELFDDGFGGSNDSAYSPQIFALVGGNGLYGGVGVGVTVSDGLADDISDPYYVVRIGWNVAVLGSVYADIHARYRFDDWEGVEEFELNSDSFTVGLVGRVRF